VVVAAGHRRWWQSLPQFIPYSNIVVEPRNRGTALAILLPLLSILKRDPGATLIVLPSDHFVHNEAVLAAAMRQAMTQARSGDGSIVLLGFSPEEVDAELGYIVPGRRADSDTREIVEVVEKPDAVWAAGALRRGALWNSFIFAAHGQRLLELFKTRVPEVVSDLEAACRHAEADASCGADLAGLYERLPTIDLSHGIVERCSDRLRVVQVPACGWSDLGTPRRVAQVLGMERLPTLRSPAPANLPGVLSLAQNSRLQSAGRDSQ